MAKEMDLLKVGDEEHHFTESNLPALIHYKENEGGSHYTMTLIENLAMQGSKALILTAFPAAKTQFLKETTDIFRNTMVVRNKNDLKKYANKQIIIINSGDEKLCLEAIKMLTDINQRIIFIKNIDIFHKHLLNTCLKYNKLILSGDIDACKEKGNVLKKKYNSVVLFSQPKIKFPYKFIPWEKNTGYIRSENKTWYVRSVA